MMSRVSFNVSGTLYETSISTIEKHPSSILNMLVQRSPSPNEPIFIDRDGAIFRWILFFYQSDMLVDHTTAGIPEQAWERELDYYGIYELIQDESVCMVNVKRKRVTEDTEFDRECRAKHEELEKRKDSKVMERRKQYKVWLTYLMSGMKSEGITCYDFAHLRGGTLQIPQTLRGQPISFIHAHWNEFALYCAEYKFGTSHTFTESTTCHSPQYAPGKFENFGGKANTVINVKIWREKK